MQRRNDFIASSLIVLLIAAHNNAAVVSGPIRTVALTGQVPPGFKEGGRFLGVVEGFSDTYRSDGSSFSVRPPVINNRGDVAFVASAEEPGARGRQSGLWVDTSGSLHLVARTGDPMPDVPATVRFRFLWGSPAFNNRGEVAFEAVTADSSEAPPFITRGIWAGTAGNLRRVVSNSVPPASLPSGIGMLSFSQPSLNNLGHVAFSAQVTRFVSQSPFERLGSGIWSDASGSVELVALEGAPAVLNGIHGTIGWNYWVPIIDDAEETTFFTSIKPPSGREMVAVWRGTDGKVRPVLAEGQAIEVGEGYDRLLALEGPLGATPNGSIVLDGILTNFRRALIVVHDEIVRVAAIQGERPPGVEEGRGFSAFWGTQASINALGRVAFRGHLENTDYRINTGVWSEGFGELKLVSRGGDAAPGTEPGLLFSGFATPQINALGQVAFAASLTGNEWLVSDQGIWAQDIAGKLRLIAREGDLLAVAPGDYRTIAELAFQNDPDATGSRRVFNDSGQIVFSALFTDGTSGVFVSNQVAVSEPNATMLGGVFVFIAFLKIRIARRHPNRTPDNPAVRGRLPGR